jgi:hypothetical protein
VLEVAPFPAEGRPAGFVDALGKFTLALEVAPRELEVGEKLQLVLTIAGQGNLARSSRRAWTGSMACTCSGAPRS